MTVKRYTPTQCCEHDGTYVTYSDYQKLVAENAALKARTPFAYSYRYAGCETCEGFQNWRWELSKERPPEWMLETGKVTNLVELFECYEAPNTDAAIAEIKAQGGVDALESLAGVAETMVVSAENASWEQGAFGWSRVKQEATKAAANLRAGRKG